MKKAKQKKAENRQEKEQNGMEFLMFALKLLLFCDDICIDKDEYVEMQAAVSTLV